MSKQLELYDWRIEFDNFINIPNNISGLALAGISNSSEPIYIPILNKSILTMNLESGIVSTDDGLELILSGPGQRSVLNHFLNFEEFKDMMITIG